MDLHISLALILVIFAVSFSSGFSSNHDYKEKDTYNATAYQPNLQSDISKTLTKHKRTTYVSYQDRQCHQVCHRECHTTISSVVHGIGKFIGSLFGKRSLRYCKDVCNNECKWVTKQNAVPRVTCPHIRDHTAGAGQTQVRVYWNSASARDVEDGTLRAKQIQGPSSGSLLGEGSYSIVYRVMDSHNGVALCSASFKVIVKKCSSSMTQNIYHGRTSCTKGRIYGSECTYSCQSGYQLIGKQKTSCLRQESWSEVTRPHCLESPCPPPLPVPHGTFGVHNSLPRGSKCTLTCDPGYSVVGNDQLVCEHGHWTDHGTCKDVQPPTFPSGCKDFVEYADRLKTNKQVFYTLPQSVDSSQKPVSVKGTPPPGSLFNIGVTDVTVTSKDQSGNIATCNFTVVVNLKKCSSNMTQNIDHGRTVCTKGRIYGSECTYSCDSGYQLIGDSKTSCLQNESWSEVTRPHCLESPCRPPHSVLHGTFGVNKSLPHGSKCNLTCDPGYEVDGNAQLVCELGRWTEHGTCTDVEPPTFPSGCQDVVEYADRLKTNKQVFYTLPQSVDSSQRPVSVTGIPLSGSSFDIGVNNVTVSAKDQSGNIATCNFTIVVNQIKCIDPINAGIDETTEHLMEFSCPNGTAYGANCTLSCADGNHVQGDALIACERNTTNNQGYWRYGSLKPSCNDKQCAAIQPPRHGSTSCAEIGNTLTCTVQCEKGYAHAVYTGGFRAAFTCNKNTAQWVPHRIRPNACRRGRPSSGASFNTDFYYYSNQCSINNVHIRENFISIMNTSSSPIFGGLCGTQNVYCKLEDVEITCGSRHKRSADVSIYASRKSLHEATDLLNTRSVNTDSYTHTTKVTFTVAMTGKTSNLSQSTIFTLFDDINEKFYNEMTKGTYDLPELGVTDDMSYGYGFLEFECPAPTVYQAESGLCVGCGPGSIYDPSQRACNLCPVGTYQPLEEADHCLPCPGMSTTRSEGSGLLDQCLDICYPGTFSKSGYMPCDLCPLGEYQPDTMRGACLKCPSGMVTGEQGAKDIDDCKRNTSKPSKEFFPISIHNPGLPFIYKLPQRLQSGDEITMKGAPISNATRFNINLQTGDCCNSSSSNTGLWGTCLMCDTVPLHVDVRFRYGEDQQYGVHRLVLSTFDKRSSSWLKRAFMDSFPFTQLQNYTLKLHVTEKGYLLYVDNNYITSYDTYVDVGQVTYIIIGGDTTFNEFDISKSANN